MSNPEIEKLLQEIATLQASVNEYIDKQIQTDVRIFSIEFSRFIKSFPTMTPDERRKDIKNLQELFVSYKRNIDESDQETFSMAQTSPLYYKPFRIIDEDTINVDLSTNPFEIDLSEIFASISDMSLIYSVRTDVERSLIRNSIKKDHEDLEPFELTGNTLTINPDYRGISYTIIINAKAKYILEDDFMIVVSEPSFPVINVLYNSVRINLGNVNNNSRTIYVPNYFQSYSSNSIPIEYAVYSNLELIDQTDSNIEIVREFHDRKDVYHLLTDTLRVVPYFSNYPIEHVDYSNSSLNINIFTSPYNVEYIFDLNLNTNVMCNILLNSNERSLIWDSNIILPDDLRVLNKKDDSLPLYEHDISTNILRLYPDFRNDYYTLELTSYLRTDFHLSNIYIINISEGVPLAPIGTSNELLTEHILFRDKNKSVDISSLFVSQTGSSLTLFCNLYDETGYEISELMVINDSKLTITPSYRNIRYEGYITAQDDIYGTISTDRKDFQITEDVVIKIDQNNPLPESIELTNQLLIYNLENHIVIGSTISKEMISYSISVDKSEHSIHLDVTEPNMLYIQGNFRNTTYVLIITISVELQDFSINVPIKIFEQPAPPPVVIFSKSIHVLPEPLTNTHRDIELDNFFISPINTEKPFEYKLELTGSNYETGLEIIDNTVRLNPNLNDIEGSFNVIAIDPIYGTSNLNSKLTIKYTELAPIYVLDTLNKEYNISNNTISIDLNTYFSSPVQNAIYYSAIGSNIDTDLRNSVIDNNPPFEIVLNKLNIMGDNRDTSYDIVVSAVDNDYETNIKRIVFSVKEQKPNKLNILQENVYIDKNILSTVIYLPQFYDYSPYYENISYQVRYLNRTIPNNFWIKIDGENLILDNIPQNQRFYFPINITPIKNSVPISDSILNINLIDQRVIRIENLSVEEYRLDLDTVSYVNIDIDREEYIILNNSFEWVKIENRKILLINPLTRNITYSINIALQNKLTGINILEIPILVSENAPFTVKEDPIERRITFDRNTQSITVDNLIDSFEVVSGSLKFVVSSLHTLYSNEYPLPRDSYYNDIPAFELNSNNGIITFNNDYRGETNELYLEVFNEINPSIVFSNIIIQVLEPLIESSILNSRYTIHNPKVYNNLENKNVVVDLVEAFNDYIYADKLEFNYSIFYENTYLLNSNEFGYLNDHHFIITPNFREISYVIEISAKDDKFNLFSDPNNLYIDVNELKKPKIIYNIDFINSISLSCVLIISLANSFN